MSLSVDGVWKAGVWATTVWADGVWREGEAPPAPTGLELPLGGKGDNDGRRRRGIFKPLGLPLERKRVEPAVAKRLDDTHEIAAEVTEQLAREFTDHSVPVGSIPIEEMSLLEVEREIGILLRKQIRTEEEEIVLLLLMAAVIA